jgi:hypothetical protein
MVDRMKEALSAVAAEENIPQGCGGNPFSALACV